MPDAGEGLGCSGVRPDNAYSRHGDCGGWPWSQAQGWHIRKSDITVVSVRTSWSLGAGQLRIRDALYSCWMTAVEYNYHRFDQYVESGAELAEFSAFPNHLHAGDPAPDAKLIRLDDEKPVQLSDLWVERNLVLEFGSFT